MLIKPVTAHDSDAGQSPCVTEAVRFGEILTLKGGLTGVDLVISPLIGPDFDAFELIERLGRSAFRGRLRIVARLLPDRALVMRELQALADPLGITIELFDQSMTQG
jgi:hypothetical protein